MSHWGMSQFRLQMIPMRTTALLRRSDGRQPCLERMSVLWVRGLLRSSKGLLTVVHCSVSIKAVYATYSEDLLIHACHAGSFTDWQDPIALRRSSENNDFIRTVALQPGTYQVDQQLSTFPCNAAHGLRGADELMTAWSPARSNNPEAIARTCSTSTSWMANG